MLAFTQVTAVRWRDGAKTGYTVFALGVDGSVYKSMPSFKTAQHKGWLKLSGNEFFEKDQSPQDCLFPASVVAS